MTRTPTPIRAAVIALAAAAAPLLLGGIVGTAPAGAAGLHPHAGVVPPSATGARPHDGGPTLTRSIFSVTDPTTGVTTTASSDIVSLTGGRLNSPTFFRPTLGGGGSFTISPSSPSEAPHAGQNLDNPTLTVSVGVAVCGGFQDSRFHGSAGATPLTEPVTGILPSRDGGGYLLTASDGGIFAYGDALFAGGPGGRGITGVVGAVG